MTVAERTRPESIDGSRRARIARGSGTDPGEVAQLIKQFLEMRSMMKGFGGAGTKKLKNKGGKGGKGGKAGGGRVTPKGPAKVPKVDLSLPGLPGF
jgi:signal recognition particle subunit SRP54